jgi:hypothetical protein
VPKGPNNPFTDEQLQKIAETLDKVEWQYTDKEEPFPSQRQKSASRSPSSSEASRSPATSSPPTNATSSSTQPSSSKEWLVEEGPDVDLTDVKARITALPKGTQDQFNRILVESNDAGRSFHVLKSKKGQPSLRRVTIVNALVDLLEASDGDEELMRYALAFALGDEVQPAVTLGCAVGSLTTLEAEKLALLALALRHNEAFLTFSEEGKAVFGGTAAMFAA